jgi:hypothetical protein
MYTLRPRRAIIDDEAGGGAWSMESMDGCFVVGLYVVSFAMVVALRFEVFL